MYTKLSARVCHYNLFLESLSVDEQQEWEESDIGVVAMEDKIALYGLDEVEDAFAPKDWASQLVGILGCGYRGVSKAAVKEALHDEGWTTTRYGALLPTGGATTERYK